MATWTDIPDEVLEPGKPIRSVDALALRDNPIAIAQGAPGAPRIQGAAFDNVSIPLWLGGRPEGAVGTYAFVSRTGTATTNWGETISGSSLLRAVILGTSSNVVSGVGALTGTWRILGRFVNSSSATLAVRIS